MRSAQFSPDGRCVVTASGHFLESGGIAGIWDTATGLQLCQPLKFEDTVQSAQFSPDGQRVVTASEDTARVWDVATGEPVGEPLHAESVQSAQFSPDGQRVLTASGYTAQVWDTPLTGTDDSKETSMLLADLAEVYGGVAFGTSSQAAALETLEAERVASIRKNIAEKMTRAAQPLTPVQRFLQWSVANRQSRTISPLSELTLPVWIENRIKDGELAGLRKAMQVAPSNLRLTAHLGRRLAYLALDPETKPDEARLAKGDADFLTRRALKIAPDNVEIQKLRAEVEKLLGAPKPGAPRSPRAGRR